MVNCLHLELRHKQLWAHPILVFSKFVLNPLSQNLFSPTMFSKYSKFLSSKLVSPVLWFVKLTLSISNASKAAEECSGNCLILILLRSESLNGNEVSLGKTNLAATTATKVYVGINLDPTHPQRKHNKNKYTQRMHIIYVVRLQYLRPTPREEKDIPLYKILSYNNVS